MTSSPIPILTFALLTIPAALAVVNACDNPPDWLAGNSASHLGKWPEGILKYQLHPRLTEEDLGAVKEAFLDIQSKTCITFQPKKDEDTDYTSIEVDDNVCGIGHVCRKGGEQFAKFGKSCRIKRTMVHQLGHNLCLGHEQSRSDRDDFVYFTGCPENEMPVKDTTNDLRGTLYDYASQMHGLCGSCEGGWPKQDETHGCGPQVETGLSVMDADKLNEMYDCGGCFAHRWRPMNALTSEERNNRVPLGRTHHGTPFHACRVLINGELCIGKSPNTQDTCLVSYGGREYFLNQNVQIFTAPFGSGSYKVVNITDFLEGRVSGTPVPSGRMRDSHDGSTGYIAVSLREMHKDKVSEFPVGKVYERELTKAYFPFFGEVEVTEEFGIVVCDQNED